MLETVDTRAKYIPESGWQLAQSRWWQWYRVPDTHLLFSTLTKVLGTEPCHKPDVTCRSTTTCRLFLFPHRPLPLLSPLPLSPLPPTITTAINPTSTTPSIFPSSPPSQDQQGSSDGLTMTVMIELNARFSSIHATSFR